MKHLAALAFSVVLIAFTALAPSVAQETGDPDAPWQDVITEQIEAFRAEDGQTALSLAGMGFRMRNPAPSQFLDWIRQTGYGPIMDSRAHSFGDSVQLDADRVLQRVTIVGEDGQVYIAVYQMGREEPGWRVYGVQLQKPESLAV